MPPYRLPTFRSLGLRLVDRSKVFLQRAGTVILGVAVVIWVLTVLPLNHGKMPDLEHSFAGMIGKGIEPAHSSRSDSTGRSASVLLRRWRRAKSLLARLAPSTAFKKTSRADYRSAIRHDLSAAGAVALLVFFAYAMQCFSTLAVVKRETGGWRWPAFQFTYMLALAYSGSWVAFHIARYFLG